MENFRSLLLRRVTMFALVAQLVWHFHAEAQDSLYEWQIACLGGDFGCDLEFANGETMIVRSAGADIWHEADSFGFAHFPWKGDFEVTARLDSVKNTHEWAKLGIMIRDSLVPESPHGFVSMSPRKGVNFIRREIYGGPSDDDSHHFMNVRERDGAPSFRQKGPDLGLDARDALTEGSLPRWVRLARRGNILTAFDSVDGLDWVWLGTASVDLGDEVFVGIAISSHQVREVCEGVVSQFSVRGFEQSRVEAPLVGSGDGWVGQYFESKAQVGPSFERLDKIIDYSWGFDGPVPTMPSDRFSARWVGELEAQYSGPHLLHLRSDDRAKLWLDGRLVIDEWYEHAAQEATALVQFQKGQRYLVRLDYFEEGGEALVQLRWSSPQLPKSIIPTSQLYSHVTDQDSDGVPALWERAFGLSDEDSKDVNTNSSQAESPESYRAAFLDGRVPGSKDGVPVRLSPVWTGVSSNGGSLSGTKRVMGSRTIELSDVGSRYSGKLQSYLNKVVEDEFEFAYREATDNFSIQAIVEHIGEGSGWAGIVLRSGIGAGDRFIGVGIDSELNGAFWTRRMDASMSSTELLAPNVRRVRLDRIGNRVVLYVAGENDDWTWVATEIFEVPGRMYVGPLVSADSPTVPVEARFSQITFGPIALGIPETRPFSGSGTGLSATYGDGLMGEFVTRIDPVIDFQWPASPIVSLGPDYFTVRWEGYLQPQFDEVYRLTTVSDDGARLWIGDDLMIDAWKDSPAIPESTEVELVAGAYYPIRLEYYDRKGDAKVSLKWSSESTPLQVIPSSQLYTRDGLPVDGVSSGLARRSIGREEVNELKDRSNEENVVDAFSGTDGEAIDYSSFDYRIVTELLEGDVIFESGTWERNGGSVRCTSRRGQISIPVVVLDTDKYRLGIAARELSSYWDRDVMFRISVDGVPIASELLNTDGAALDYVELPFLNAGVHSITLFWDNARRQKSMQIDRVTLEAAGVELSERGELIGNERLAFLEKNNLKQETTIRTAVSPVQIEGISAYPAFVRIDRDGRELTPASAGNGGWYLDLDLEPSEDVEVTVSFENYVITQQVQVVWEPLDMSSENELFVRRGDVVVLNTTNSDSLVGASILFNGQSVGVYDGNPFKITFNTPGQCIVQLGDEQLLVDVALGYLGPDVAAVVKNPRPWEAKDVNLNRFSIELDDNVRLVRSAGSAPAPMRAMVVEDFGHYTVSLRDRKTDLIVDTLTVTGLSWFHGEETGGLYPVRRAGLTRNLWATDLVLYPLLDDVSVEVGVVVGGVAFDDGTLAKSLASTQFEATGLSTFYFLRSAESVTSTCHELSVYQRGVRLY